MAPISVRSMLLAELKKARAPFTHSKVATVLKTDRGRMLCGHNIEYAKDDFRHAERNAIKALPKDGSEKIVSVYMGGSGKLKIKQISPCNECFKAIEPFLAKDAKVTLFEPNSMDRWVNFSRRQVQSIYGALPYSEIKGSTPVQIGRDIRKKTLLRGTDARFAVALRLFGLETGIRFYLTGSKSGRGGVGTAIYKRRGGRSDIDLLAVTEKPADEVKKIVLKIASRYYDIARVERFVHEIFFIGEVRIKADYYDKSGSKVIDFCVGKTLRSSMSRMDYYKKNWWHRLS